MISPVIAGALAKARSVFNLIRRRPVSAVQAVSQVNQQIEAIEADLLHLPQVECPLVHRFAPGVYARQITMPAGSLIIGHCHNTKHFNVVLKGRARVMMEDQIEDIVAPCVFVSEAGVRKVLRIDEEMVWMTIHPTHETDLKKLEEEIITKSPAFTKHFEQLEQLKALPPNTSGEHS